VRARLSPGAMICRLGGSTTRHRLASLASLFECLCERNAVTHNPVKGRRRLRTQSGEGKTPGLGDHQARKLLAAPEADTIKSKRDRAILSTLLFHALRGTPPSPWLSCSSVAMWLAPNRPPS
jgi:site-specific recombinase XerC